MRVATKANPSKGGDAKLRGYSRCALVRGARPVGLPNEPKEGFMLPTPWSLGFVLATIVGAMLVPG